MAVLTLRDPQRKIEVTETTAEIELQKRLEGDAFQLHRASDGQVFKIKRTNVLVMADSANWEG